MKTRAEEFIPTRPSLLCRLKDWENGEDWKIFFDTYWRLIFSVALKAGLTENEAEEVVQETIISVCKQMPDFEYNKAGSFKAWLLQIVRRRVSDQFRKRAPIQERPTEDTRTDFLERIPSSEARLEDVWEEEWRRNLIETAITKVKNRIKPRFFQIFDLVVLKEWPVSEVARGLNVSSAQVYLTRHRVTRLIRDEVRRMEKEAGSRSHCR